MGVLSGRKKNHERCRFCDWLEKWEEWRHTSEGKARVICENRNWVALLDKYPKVKGDTLVISRKPYDDLLDIAGLSIEESYDFFEIVRKVSANLQKKLSAEKVYIISICEHWEGSEISYADKKTSEHLHFHLIPRYKHMKKKSFKPRLIDERGFVPEKIFLIDGQKASIMKLRNIGKKIRNC